MNATEERCERATGCIVGALIGDALGLGPHWYYDLDELRRDFGKWIDDYTALKPGRRYHEGMKAGELSQTGIIMKLLLRSVVERNGYLYAFKESGSVYQPVYLGQREDIPADECTVDQLKYKPTSVAA